MKNFLTTLSCIALISTAFNLTGAVNSQSLKQQQKFQKRHVAEIQSKIQQEKNQSENTKERYPKETVTTQKKSKQQHQQRLEDEMVGSIISPGDNVWN